MNYWPVETCNLSELHEPLFDLIEKLREPDDGRRVAKFYYGAGDSSCTTIPICGDTPFRLTAPAWHLADGRGLAVAHLAEHYDFTRDRKFLRNALTRS